ncbi:hypothetical protein JCM14469_40290 [Desulfatiferula olefinivorans]
MNSLMACLKKGIGISLCPEISVRGELSSGSLARLKWPVENMETSVLMIWHNEKWCSPLLKEFMDMSLDRMKV